MTCRIKEAEARIKELEKQIAQITYYLKFDEINTALKYAINHPEKVKIYDLRAIIGLREIIQEALQD